LGDRRMATINGTIRIGDGGRGMGSSSGDEGELRWGVGSAVIRSMGPKRTNGAKEDPSFRGTGKGGKYTLGFDRGIVHGLDRQTLKKPKPTKGIRIRKGCFVIWGRKKESLVNLMGDRRAEMGQNK